MKNQEFGWRKHTRRMLVGSIQAPQSPRAGKNTHRYMLVTK